MTFLYFSSTTFHNEEKTSTKLTTEDKSDVKKEIVSKKHTSEGLVELQPSISNDDIPDHTISDSPHATKVSESDNYFTSVMSSTVENDL